MGVPSTSDLLQAWAPAGIGRRTARSSGRVPTVDEILSAASGTALEVGRSGG